MSANAKNLRSLLKCLSAPVAVSSVFLGCSGEDKDRLNYFNDDATVATAPSADATAPGGNATANPPAATSGSSGLTPVVTPTSGPAVTPPPAPGSGNTGGTGPAPQVGNGGNANPATDPTEPVSSGEPAPSMPSQPTSEGMGGMAPVEPIPVVGGTGGVVSNPEPLPMGGTAPVASGGAPVVDDGRGPRAPAVGDIVVLYDGNGFGAWEPLMDGLNTVNWTEDAAEGWMQVLPTRTNHIITNQQNLHEDVFLHLEFWSPDEGAGESGQGRGNSGVYMQSRFELQILDSYGRQPETDGCGSIYGVAAPLVNACTPPEEWNTYEIDYTAPRYEGGVKISNARITAWLNDQLVQDGVEVSGTTSAGIPGEPNGPQPLYLQDHTDTVRFRNIWWIHK